MPLAPADVATRIKAARLLRGVSQRALSQQLAEDGLAGRVAGALERGQLELRPVHVRALCDALGLPERWFTEPLEELFPVRVPESIEERLDRISAQLELVLRR